MAEKSFPINPPADSSFFLQCYEPYLEKMLTPLRLQHSVGVMQVMGELAVIYRLDSQQAQLAGLLHDAAKDLSPSQAAHLVNEGGITIEAPCEADYNYFLHGPVGAYLVYKELNVRDEQVLDAIYMHTYCGSGVNLEAPLTWCLRFADILEPYRNWSRVPWLADPLHGGSRLRQLAYAGKMQAAAWLQTRIHIAWFEATGQPIHPNLRRIHHSLTIRLEGDPILAEVKSS